jgi:PIN domain nuclease of toxin-antitoxin system
LGIFEVIVLDTHAWVWWASSPELLSAKARKAIEQAVIGRAFYISSISAWEVAMLAEKGRLQLTMPVKEWIAVSEGLPFVTFVPVNNNIAIKSVQLPGKLHNDPADRIIISTAISLGAVLVTMDEKIRSYSHVKALW